MVDRRIEKSQKAIHKAFIKLLVEKHYDEINVREIAREADIVSRTFYHHYKDKDDLARQILTGMVEQAISGVDSSTDLATIEANNLLVLQYATTNKQIIHILRDHIKLPDLLKAAMPVLKREGQRVFAERHAQGSGRVPLDMVSQHFSFSMLSLVFWWLEHDMPIPVEEMAGLMNELVIRPLWEKLE